MSFPKAHKATRGIPGHGFPGEASLNWQQLLGRPSVVWDTSESQALHSGKVVMVTGGGGSIGSYLSAAILEGDPRQLLLVDSSEYNLYRTHAELTARGIGSSVIPILLDICNAAFLDQCLEANPPDIIYHTAAFKHVPLLEANPLAAVRNNVIGAYVLANAAVRHQVGQMVAISTDKAADPRSVLGVSKRIAELILLALGDSSCRMKSVRFGNVLGSHGSVVPLFLEQISRGGPVTVTHRDASRYFLTMDESIGLIFATANRREPAGLFVPELGEPMRVVELAERLIHRAGFGPGSDVAIEFVGLRPGDKMTESLISSRERRSQNHENGLYEVSTPTMSRAEVMTSLAELESILETCDVAALIDALCHLVPEYQPSEDMRKLLGSYVRSAR